MSGVALTAEELMAWVEVTADGWKRMGEAQPAMLLVPCDIYTAKSVGELLRHIVAVELRYAERLAGLEQTPYERIPFGTAEEIFRTHARAMELLRGLLADPAYDWEKVVEFGTLSSGRMRASRKTILFHELLHGIRHYAQLATLVRQHGFKPDWSMDYLFLAAERV